MSEAVDEPEQSLSLISEDKSCRSKRSLALSSDDSAGFTPASKDKPTRSHPSTEVAPVWKPKWNPWLIAMAVRSFAMIWRIP